MIEWKRIDKNNPPKGAHLFVFDGTIYSGWALYDPDEGLDERDDEGYPMWEVNEGRECHNVRWYAEINLPNKEEMEGKK